MKAFIYSDEINHFHWSMLKSVLLVLSLLPLSQALLHLWKISEGSSQIMVGFFALSLMSASLILSFCSAIKVTVLSVKDDSISAFEQGLIYVYKQVPMFFLATMLSYLLISY